MFRLFLSYLLYVSLSSQRRLTWSGRRTPWARSSSRTSGRGPLILKDQQQGLLQESTHSGGSLCNMYRSAPSAAWRPPPSCAPVERFTAGSTAGIYIRDPHTAEGVLMGFFTLRFARRRPAAAVCSSCTPRSALAGEGITGDVGPRARACGECMRPGGAASCRERAVVSIGGFT